MDYQFAALEQEQVEKAVEQLVKDSSYNPHIALTLVNGEILTGTLNNYSNKSDTPLKDAHLLLRNYNKLSPVLIHIPIAQISGISSLDFYQDTIKVDSYPTTVKTFASETLAGSAIDKSKLLKFDCKNEIVHYCLSDEKFVPGDVILTNDTILYRDHQYFVDKEIKVPIGISIGKFLTGSVQYEFKFDPLARKLRKKPLQFGKAKDHKEVTLEGYLSIMQDSTSKEFHKTNIEGTDWVHAIISQRPIEKLADLKFQRWHFVYLRIDSFYFPLSHFDLIKQQVRIFGSVVAGGMRCSAGNTDCCIKARGVAYLK